MRTNTWANVYLDTAVMMHASETIAWPKVQAAIMQMGIGIREDEQNRGLDSVKKSYHEWSLQCRKTALPAVLHPRVVELLVNRLDALQQPGAEGAGPTQLDADDPKTVQLLEDV